MATAIKCHTVFVKNPNKVFYSGQVIRGSICLTLKSEQVLRDIQVKIGGLATTTWDLGRVVRCSKVDCLKHQMSILNFSMSFETYF